MKKGKIAIFGVKYFPSKGGTSRVVENLLWHIKDQYDFTVYCHTHPEAAGYMPGVNVVQFPEVKIKGIGAFIHFMQCCLHLLFKRDFDLVHIHKVDASFFAPLISLKYKIISTSHALPHLDDKWPVIGKLYFKIAEWIFMHSKGTLTCISKILADYYEKTYQREVLFIPNAVNPILTVDTGKADEIIESFRVKPGFLLFAARRIIPLKGCHTLIEALKRINFQGTLVVAGETGHLSAYTKKLQDAVKGLDVKFIGYISDMQVLNALIKRARYFVFPSEIEAMSMMLLEAGSLGTPMICSDIPQNTVIFDDGEVLYFQSKNAEDLAEKLSWAFENPEKMNFKAEKATQKVEQKYLIDQVVKQYTDLYDRELEGVFQEENQAMR
jgi:glycosyltransferase involved in cell wall biosynthesis